MNVSERLIEPVPSERIPVPEDRVDGSLKLMRSLIDYAQTRNWLPGGRLDQFISYVEMAVAIDVVHTFSLSCRRNFDFELPNSRFVNVRVSAMSGEKNVGSIVVYNSARDVTGSIYGKWKVTLDFEEEEGVIEPVKAIFDFQDLYNEASETIELDSNMLIETYQYDCVLRLMEWLANGGKAFANYEQTRGIVEKILDPTKFRGV